MTSHNARDYKKYVSKQSFVSQKIFPRKNFVAIYEIKPVLTLDKPSYVGFSIFDLSKLLEVHSCKLYYNKYMIALTKIANTEVFAFIVALVFKLLNRKVLLTSIKDNRNC